MRRLARNGFYASTIISGSYSNYSTRRPIEFGTIDRTARGDLNGGSVGTFLKAGYDLKVGGFTFGPVVSGQYTYLGVAPFTESGADSLNLRVRQQNLNSLQFNVGGRLACTWSLADGKILLIPQARMFWNHEFLQNSTSIWSSLDGGAGPGFEYRTINPRETPSLRRGPDHSTRTQLECERLLQHRFRKRHLQYTNRVGKRGLPLVEPFLKGVKTSSGTTREFRLRRSSPKAHAGTRDGYLLKRCPPENTRFLKRANRFES
jgi:Autotransporter beta-domain